MTEPRAIMAALLLAAFPLMAFAPNSAAVNGKLNQNIYPLDCVFQEVNDGTGAVIFVTPQECGVITPPIDVEPDADNEKPRPIIVLPDRQTSTLVDTGVGVMYLPDTRHNSNKREILLDGRLLPYQPAARFLDQKESVATETQTLGALPGATIAVTMLALGLVVIIALL